MASGPLFFPTQQIVFRGLGIGFCVGNRLHETEPNQVLSTHSNTGVHSNQDLIWCVKIVLYMGFWVDRGSWLLWPPEVIDANRCHRGEKNEKARVSTFYIIIARVGSCCTQCCATPWVVHTIPLRVLLLVFPSDVMGRGGEEPAVWPRIWVTTSMRERKGRAKLIDGMERKEKKEKKIVSCRFQSDPKLNVL